MPEEPSAGKWTINRDALAVVVGLVSGVLFVLVPYASVWLFAVATGGAQPDAITSASGFNLSLTLLFPIVQGFALAIMLGRAPNKTLHIVRLLTVLTAIQMAVAAVFLREGVVCLIILAPLAFALMSVGAIIGRFLVTRNVSHRVHVSLIPLVFLAVVAEAAGPPPRYSGVVVDEVVIDAPPELVWRYVASYPENNAPPDYWLWRIGLPYPVQSIASAETVGADRVCRFSDGSAFDERIVELDPGRVMTFEVTRQPDHPEVNGHFRFLRGEIRLTANDDGSTTVTASSWYELYVRPALYFDLWTADITRQVHFRVLNHTKDLAERDHRTGQGVSN